MPPKAAEDAAHVAIATVHGLAFLLTVGLCSHCKRIEPTKDSEGLPLTWQSSARRLHTARTSRGGTIQIRDEVQSMREAIEQEHDYDVSATFAMFRQAAAASSREHVHLSASTSVGMWVSTHMGISRLVTNRPLLARLTSRLQRAAILAASLRLGSGRGSPSARIDCTPCAGLPYHLQTPCHS
jgi:hypothetical protein